jgi:hypothetical protein
MKLSLAYVGHRPGTSDFGDLFAAVGLSSGLPIGAGNFSSLPGNADGLLVSAGSNLLAWEDGSYLIFRPSDNGYEASKEFIAAVPEPSFLGLFALGLRGLGGVYGNAILWA